MALKRTVPTVDEQMGAVRLTIDDLVELETLLPQPDRWRWIKVGPYDADQMEDLRQSSERSALRLSIVGSVRVVVHGTRTSVQSQDEEHNVAATAVVDFLRRRRVRRVPGFDTPARAFAYGAWGLVAFGVMTLVFGAYEDLDSRSPPTIAAFVGWLVLLVLTYGVYLVFTHRVLPPYHPVQLAASDRDRWIDRHGVLLAIVVTALVGVATIVTTILVAT